MSDFILPAVLNEPLARRDVRAMGADKPDIVYRVARNIHVRCRLAEAQNWRCCWCGQECTAEPNYKNSATIEHVTPRSLGGSNHWDNLAMACARCNHKRGNATVADMLAGRVEQILSAGSKRKTSAERLDARMNKYRRRVQEFNQNGWRRGCRRIDPREWLQKLSVTEDMRKELREMAGI